MINYRKTLLLLMTIQIVFIIPFCKSQNTTICSNGLVRSITASNTVVNYIESRSYPNSYPNNGACNIIITSALGYVIKFKFEGFIKNSDDNTFFLHDGPTTSDPNLVNIKSIDTSTGYTSSGTSVYLRNIQSNKGNKVFRIAYIAVSGFPSCASAFTLHGASTSQKTIESHSSYPIANYDNNVDTYWLIQKPRATDLFKFFFEDFKTEADKDGCTKFDRFVIYDGPCTTDDVILRFCGIQGSTLPYSDSRTVTTSGKYLLLRLITDGSVTFSGFRMKFSTEAVKPVNDNENNDGDDKSWIAGPIVCAIIVLICLYGHCQRKQKQSTPAATATNRPNTANNQNSTSTNSNEARRSRIEENDPSPSTSAQSTEANAQADSVYSPPPSYEDLKVVLNLDKPPPYSESLNYPYDKNENINPSAPNIDNTPMDNGNPTWMTSASNVLPVICTPTEEGASGSIPTKFEYDSGNSSHI